MNTVFSFFKRKKEKTDHLDEVRREQGARLAQKILTLQHQLASYLNAWQHRVGFRTRNAIILIVMFGLLLVFLIPSIQSLIQYSSNNGNKSTADTTAGQLFRGQSTTAKPDSLTARSGGGQDSTQAQAR